MAAWQHSPCRVELVVTEGAPFAEHGGVHVLCGQPDLSSVQLLPAQGQEDGEVCDSVAATVSSPGRKKLRPQLQAAVRSLTLRADESCTEHPLHSRSVTLWGTAVPLSRLGCPLDACRLEGGRPACRPARVQCRCSCHHAHGMSFYEPSCSCLSHVNCHTSTVTRSSVAAALTTHASGCTAGTRYVG